MTIERGREWGIQAPLPPDACDLPDERAFGRLVDECRRAGRAIPPCFVRTGGLARTTGSSAPAPDVPESGARMVRLLPIDIGRVRIDGADHWFASHLIARRSWWFGQVVVVMNAEFLGDWDVAPRGHPNDGRFDVLEASAALPVGQRWRARNRLATGAHLPHPLITERRLKHQTWHFERPMHVWVDGMRYGAVRDLEFTVEPDAAVLCV